MRLFVGIAIPEPVRSNLRALLNTLRPLADFRWTPIENIHITTKFIGEFPEDRLDEMKAALGAVASPPFDISIHNLGWFPNPHHPRVFWAGVDGGSFLRALAAATDEATSHLEVPKERTAVFSVVRGSSQETREFRPHLTLARLKNPSTPLESIRHGVASLNSQDFGSFRAAGFVLYLSAQGQYTSLAEFPLKT